MKKYVAMFLCLLCLLSACAEAPQVRDPRPTGIPETAGQFTEAPETTGAASTVFLNEQNFTEDPGSVSVKPRYVYWEGDILVAECFVINGTDAMVYNICVERLAFANETQSLADAAFGVLEGLNVGAHSYAVWTFRFAPDVVLSPGGDLSYLHYECSTSYAY